MNSTFRKNNCEGARHNNYSNNWKKKFKRDFHHLMEEGCEPSSAILII